MSIQQVVPGFYWISLGFVNAYLLETQTGLVLIDTGIPNSSKSILSSVASLGKQPSDIKHILLLICMETIRVVWRHLRRQLVFLHICILWMLNW